MSKEKQAQIAQINAENDIVADLFSQELTQDPSDMKTKETYVAFGKQVGGILYAGQAPYHIPAFFQELARGLSKTTASAEDMKKIVDYMTI